MPSWRTGSRNAPVRLPHPAQTCYPQSVSELRIEGLRSVRGQIHATSLLARAAASGRLANAYLLEGPSGVGKTRTALALAQVTVCNAIRPDGDPCGECSPCRQVATGRHVDVIILAREIDV